MFEEEKEKIEEISESIKKKWYKSKTIIFNMFAIALASVEQNFMIIKENFDINIFLVLSVAVPTINFYLRTITSKPIEKKEDKKNEL